MMVIKELSEEQVVDLLLNIIEQFSVPGRGVAETYRIVVNKLKAQLEPKPSWSWNFIHNVAHRRLKVSKRLAYAILLLNSKIKREATLPYEVVTVIAPIGYLPTGAIVSTRAKKCANVDCTNYFIPANPNHRFCSKHCRSKRKGQS